MDQHKYSMIGILFISVLAVGTKGEFLCGHAHNPNKKTPKVRVEKADFLLGDNDSPIFRPMKVAADFSNLRNRNFIDEKVKNLISEVLVPRAAAYLSGILQVKGPTFLSVSEEHCGGDIVIPPQFRDTAFETDLFLFVDGFNEAGNSYLAFASSCQLNSYNNRPNVGIISFNAAGVSLALKEVDSMISATLHEMIHVVGFDSQLFPSFPLGIDQLYEAENAADGTVRAYLKSPGLVAHARAHFNCSSLTRVPLENEGGASSATSHFEKLVLGNELMTAQLSAASVVSPFTLQLLADSGWYSVEFGKAESLGWGQGRGCDFAKGSVADSAEVCRVMDQAACTVDRTGMSICGLSVFSDGFMVRNFFKDGLCTTSNFFNSSISYLPTGWTSTGGNSRCFELEDSESARPGCFPTFCDVKGVVTLTLNATNYTCTSSNQVIFAGPFRMQCPDPLKICADRPKCPGECSGNGKCLSNGTCLCDFLFKGPACDIHRVCDDAVTCERLAIDRVASASLVAMTLIGLVLLLAN